MQIPLRDTWVKSFEQVLVQSPIFDWSEREVGQEVQKVVLPLQVWQVGSQVRQTPYFTSKTVLPDWH